MSSATTSLENQQRNGRLKLKIKFSRSKGFVSDFVSEAASDVHGKLRTTSNEPASEIEQLFSSQCAEISSVECSHEQLLSSQHVDVSGVDKKLNTLISKPAGGHQESSNSNSTSNGLDLHCCPDNSDQQSTKEPVGGLKEGKPVSQSVHSSLDNTRLFPEINGPHHTLGNEDTNIEKLFFARTEPKQADLLGVNYGKMLQDLEFLSAQQDEPDGRDPSPVCRQKERHMTLVSSLTPSQTSKPTMMESGCMIEGKPGTGDTQAREEASDGEPMSPFDINCSLGFADEDFTFTAPIQNPPQKQNSQKEMKENPLFPWSVDVSTKSDTQTASLLDNETQPGSGDRVLHAGSWASFQCNSSSQFVKTSVEQSFSHGSFHRDWRNVGADREKQAVTINFQDRGGSSLGNEINNNSHDSSSVFRNGPSFQSGPVQIPHRIAFVSTAAAAQPQDSRLYLPLTSFGGSSGAESENHRSLTRTLSSDSAINSQHKLSVFSDSGFSGLESRALHYSSSVFYKRPSVDTAAAERTSKQMSASSASHHPLVPHVRGKNSDGEEGESDFVIKLLSDDGTASKASQSRDTSSSSVYEDNMKQLAENPPSVEPLLTPLNSLTPQTPAVTLSSGSATVTTPNQLNRTIDELRKRVAEKVLPEDFSSTSTECRPPSQECSFENRSVTSGSAKNIPCKLTQWCACAKQDLSIFPKDHENVIDGKESQEKFCRRCGKRTKRKRKNKEAVWCRCDSPDVYLPNGTITELCRKCMKRVSKQWRKRTAAKWCKCHTPVLCTFTSANNNQGENTKSKFYVCKRCQKWISKDREDVCMKGDSFGKMPGENVLPPASLQSLMTDHNYCQSVASATTHPKPPAPSGTSLVLQSTLRLEQSAALQDSGTHNLLLQTGAGMVDTSKTIVYVFPSRAIVNKNSSSQNRQSAASNGVNHSDLQKVPTSSAQTATSSSSGCVMPSSSSSSSWRNILSSLRNLQNSSATSGLPASHGDYPSLRTLLGQDTSKGNEEKAKSVLTDRKRKSKQIKCPAWLNGISRDLLQPCYVVMEKLDSKTLFKGAAVEPVSPCSVSCRQSSLNVKCGLGDLRQCGHSLECRYLLDKYCDVAGSVSDLNRKREYFRKNKTLVGFEEAQQKEKEELKCRKDSSVSGTDVIHTVSSPGFHPLSSEHQPGFTNFRITSQNGVTVQRLSETFTPPADTFQQHDDQLQGTVENDNPSAAAARSVLVDESSVGTRDKANGINGNSAQLLHSSHMHAKNPNQTPVSQGSRKIWSRKSRFRVKYYVFGAQDRAFIVPLIQNRRHSPQTPLQLDEEDMDYVRKAIDQLLTEKNSSARHLPYPDSLQHKGSSETVGQSANKKTFVAPTLGGEDLDIEALKSLISDRDFSRLVPRNNRISKSRYLQEIGEKVHMYLTGGCEETPEWIKDVAKSIVMKHRKTVKKKNKKNRLKPSKDVSIEIDYAEEEETLEVDDEGMLSPSHSSVTDGDLSTTGSCMAGLEAETPDQCSNHVQGQLSEADHVSNPTGSYVVAEAFAQEEKKPLLQNITEALQQSTVTSADDSVPAPGQQIFVPLPEMCGYGLPPEVEQTSQSIPSSPPFVPQHYANESVGEEQQDRKPLLGELLVAASLLPGPTCTETTDINAHGENEQEQEQHSTTTGQPSPPPQQLPVWPLAKVKEEPPEEDFSHAWASHGQHEDMGQSCSTLHNREGVDTIPFISNSTFGKDAVQVEDEEGSAVPDVDRLSQSASEVHPVVKMEQPDAESSGTVGVPMITCVAPGELGAALTDNSEASDMKVSISQIFFSVACAEAGDGDTGVHADTSDSVIPNNFVEIASCKDQAAADQMPPEVSCPSEQKMTVGSEAHEGALTYGELVDRSVEHQISKLFKDSETVNTSEQTQVIIMPESVDLPLISAVSSGEAAKLWEAEGDRLSADTLEALEPSDSTSSGQPEILPVISSVLCGEAVVHEGGDTASLFYHESENGHGHQTDLPEDENEEYREDFQGDDDYYEEDDGESDMQPVGARQAHGGESDLKPIITGDGQILAIPMILPSEGTVSETREQQPLSVPQIGVDLSIVKQEPEEVVDFSVAFMDDTPFENTEVGPDCNTTLPSHQYATNVSSFVEESSSVPSILEVRSLANMNLPSDRAEGNQDTSEASHRLENQSATKTPFLQAEFSEHPRSDCDAPQSDSSQSESVIPNINCDVSKITEAKLDEEIGHLADEIRESLEKPKPAPPSKRNTKKSRKPAGKKKRQQKTEVRAVLDLPDLMQGPSETKNSSVCGNAVRDAQSVDSFIPPILPPSSLAAGKVSSPVGQVNVMEDEQESLSTDSKLEPPSPATLSMTSKTPIVTLGGVISSDRKSADKDIVDGKNIVSESDMFSAGESFPMNKLSSLKTDLIPAGDSTEPSKQKSLKSCRDKLQASSGAEIDVSSKDGHPVTTTPAGEAVPSPKDSQWNMDDSQLVNKEGLERDEAQVLSKSAAKDTCALTSHEVTPDVTDVPAIENDVHVPAVTNFPNKEDSRKGSSTDTVETQKKSPTVAEVVQKDDSLPLIQENKARSRDGSPMKSPEQDSVGSESQHDSDLNEHQRKYNHNLTTLTDTIDPDHEKRTLSETCESIVLETEDSHKHSLQIDHMETNDVLQNTCSEKSNAKTRKSKRRGGSRSKGGKRNSSKSRKMAICSSSHVPTLTSPSLNITDTDSQDTVITADGAVFSNDPSLQTVSNKMDVPVLTLKINHSSVSPSQCLSENQVSSSCDVLVTSQKSDFVSIDPNGEIKPSSMLPDTLNNDTEITLKNDSEGKSVELNSKLHLRPGSRSFHHLVQDNSKEVQHCASPDRGDNIDESVHYVSQLCERRGEQGRPCLVLRKKRPAQSSPITSDIHEQRKEKDFPVPLKKIKGDTTCEPLLSKTSSQANAELTVTKGLKRKSDDLNADSPKSSKLSKSERSIFSDFSALISSMSASDPASTSAAPSRSCPGTDPAMTQAVTEAVTDPVMTMAVTEAVTKTTDKGFSKNMFSRLRASLVSVKDNVTAKKDEGLDSTPVNTVSGAPPQSVRERSFFDCLPQSLLDAWKNK